MEGKGFEDYGCVALTAAFYGCCEAAKPWGGGLLVLWDLSVYLGGNGGNGVFSITSAYNEYFNACFWLSIVYLRRRHLERLIWSNLHLRKK